MRAVARPLAALGALGLLGVAPALGADEPPRPAVFALIMGVNRSVDADLKPLLYADDDAVRYQELFRSLGAKTQLLARLDRETTALSPQAAAEALPPTRASLRKVVSQLAAEIALARQRGVKTSLYVLYAGHGNVDGQRSYLTLEDARLSGPELGREILDPINADQNHLIVDACYSYLLVGERGPGGERHPVVGFSATSELARRSNLGLLLSTSSGVESHEWGAFQAGVFSYEVRSGLYGAADLNGDGTITYAEIASFLERANQPIENEKFRPHVFARAATASAQLLDLRGGLGRSLAIEGDLPSAHYLVEDPRGVRFLDFHNAQGRNFRLVRPGGASALYVRRIDDDQELTVPASDEPIALASTGFTDSHVASRGAIHYAFSQIFSLPFDRASEALVAIPRPPPPPQPVREGLTLAIVGRPNVGKSSLFNCLLNEERAIVTSTPGTTRDLVAETANIGGIPLRFVDTAGIRHAMDEAERMGVERSWQAIADSNLRLLVVDASEGWTREDSELLGRMLPLGALLISCNKSDLPHKVSGEQLERTLGAYPGMTLPKVVWTSALTGEGLPQLREDILEVAAPARDLGAEGEFITNLRHQQLLKDSLLALAKARDAADQKVPHEMLLIDLYEALHPIDQITGATYVDDVLDIIFSTFCVGK